MTGRGQGQTCPLRGDSPAFRLPATQRLETAETPLPPRRSLVSFLSAIAPLRSLSWPLIRAPIPYAGGQAKRSTRLGIYAEARGKKGKAIQYEPDPDLRDFENVPLKENIVSFFLREVRPFVDDAWIDPEAKDEKDGGIGKVGYEISFNREFFRYQPPRSLAVIDSELATVEKRILGMLKEVTE